MATKEPDANFSDSFNRLNMDDRVGPDGEPLPKTEDEYAQSQLTLRAVVSSKEAGVIIGKAGKNVADLRDATGVKAGVSKVITGVNDRVLTVSGELDGISKAYMIVAKGLLEGAAPVGMGGIVQTNGTHRKSRLDLQAARVSSSVSLVSFLSLTRPGDSSSSHLTQSNGYHHRTTGAQNQADPGHVRCAYGCAEGNAAPVNRAYCRDPGPARRHPEGSLGDR